MDVFHPAVAKRQNYILAIPTTYQGLNDGPAPGAVAGIMLGSIGGFVLVLFLFLSLYRLYSGRTFHHRESGRASITSPFAE